MDLKKEKEHMKKLPYSVKTTSMKIGISIDSDLFGFFTEHCALTKRKKSRVISDLIRAYLRGAGYDLNAKALGREHWGQQPKRDYSLGTRSSLVKR